MDSMIDFVGNTVRKPMRAIARLLNTLSRGRLSPSVVTYISLIAHVPIAYLIAMGNFIPATILLVIFGLFDTLDGELARLQKTDGPRGMVLDASTDRMKESLLYIGLAYFFVQNDLDIFAVWSVAVCAGALLVSYVKAKAETAVKDKNLSANQINRLFKSGLMRYEVRMFVLVIGLLFNVLSYAVVILAITTWLTAFWRLAKVLNGLR
ncbi:MAG TPA: CDP-alcohol phosphatidyltransferase family protein [Candidatus Saccharibacteria bacterium]|nr:CDP-alcohol phosphatidyltransferase family protein [Candidatus Saccharibacteria bacterium]